MDIYYTASVLIFLTFFEQSTFLFLFFLLRNFLRMRLYSDVFEAQNVHVHYSPCFCSLPKPLVQVFTEFTFLPVCFRT
jgi:hypothetical protein